MVDARDHCINAAFQWCQVKKCKLCPFNSVKYVPLTYQLAHNGEASSCSFGSCAGPERLLLLANVVLRFYSIFIIFHPSFFKFNFTERPLKNNSSFL